MERRLTRTVGSPGSVLVWSKLTPPAPRAGTITRSGLQSLLQAGLEAKLCLLDAPAGSGKTTLLAQWSATAGAGRVAWVSLDEGDNDPTRLWIYISEALRTVEPGVGTATLQALGRPTWTSAGRSCRRCSTTSTGSARRWCWCWTTIT